MKAIHIIVGAVVAVAAIGGMIAYKMMDDAAIVASSDSANVNYTIRIGVDNWAGYYPLCSAETRKRALDKGVLVECKDDGANFAQRMKNLRTGELQMAAITADSYVRNGAEEDFPGSVIFVIDESQGGDAIIASRSVAPNGNIDDLKGKKGLKIAFTSDSPSEMLVTAWKRDFGIPIDDPTLWTIVPADGSSDALKKLQSGEVQVAVLWQPDVAKALDNQNFVKLLGTEDTKNLIVDTLVASHNFISGSPEAVQILMASYFEALEHYKTHPDEFDRGLATYAGVKLDQVQALKDGIDWIDLPRNGVDWMGVQYAGGQGRRQLYDTINTTTRIMVQDGQISSDTLPGGDAFRLINSTPFAQVFDMGINGTLAFPFVLPNQITDVSLTRKFKKLSPGRWGKLAEIGSVHVPPITFNTGTSVLYPDGQEAFDAIANILTTYPRYRIKVVGHTGRGDKIANAQLSKKRATNVAKYLRDKLGLDKNRIMTIGRGNDAPPARAAGEGKRAWWARWPRVELVLVQE